MRQFGLIGFPLAHSFSEKYFSEKFITENISDASYKLFPLKNINLLKNFITEHPNLVGFNVTIPYKIKILPFLHEIDDAAKKIGAVNTVCVKISDGKFLLKGYNTDAFGFEKSINPLLKSQHNSALIFGNGGSAKAVKYVLESRGIECKILIRKNDSKNPFTFENISPEIIDTHKLIVNTTPIGMHPNTENFPNIPYEKISDGHLLFDLIYNPEETQFLTKGKLQGATIKNGLEMLHLQAEKSWEIWNTDE